MPPHPSDRANDFTKRIPGLTDIMAERIGPRAVYLLDDWQTVTVVGPIGAHAVSVMHWGRNKKAIDTLAVPEIPNTLLRQVGQRMKAFSPGCALMVQQIPQADAVMLALRKSDDTDFHCPIHAGFGLTQVFPIYESGSSCYPFFRASRPDNLIAPVRGRAVSCSSITSF